MPKKKLSKSRLKADSLRRLSERLGLSGWRMFAAIVCFFLFYFSAQENAWAQTFVVVQKEPIHIHRVQADLDTTPSKETKTPGTTWSFKCANTIFYRMLFQSQKSGQCDVEILVTGVSMRVGLDVDVIFAKHASLIQKEEEEGHVIVLDRVFQKAEEIARIAGENSIGRKVSGRGSNSKMALANAVNSASEDLVKSYRRSTSDVAQSICNTFDRMRRDQMHTNEAVDLCFRAYD